MSNRKLIIALFVTLITICVSLLAFNYVRAYDYICSNQQTPIGNGECRIEPTGCPYGDSIPVQSPKCVPPPEDQTPVVENPPAPTEEPTDPSTPPQGPSCTDTL